MGLECECHIRALGKALAQCKSVLGSRDGFKDKDLLPCFYFQIIFFSLPFVCSNWSLPSSRVRMLIQIITFFSSYYKEFRAEGGAEPSKAFHIGK